MVFGIFGSKKKKEDRELLKFGTVDEITGRANKILSLRKLNRLEEAEQLFAETEQFILQYLRKGWNNKTALMMLVIFFSKTGSQHKAEVAIKMLTSGEFPLRDDERNALAGEMLKIQRQRPTEKRTDETAPGYTQVYNCANCGRLHNYASMPCPHCDWCPTSIEEMTRSILLSNVYMKVPDILYIARLSGGKPIDKIVPNLATQAQTYLNDPAKRKNVEEVFSLLVENKHKNHRSLSVLRECSSCGSEILQSNAPVCAQCGELTNRPDAVRTLLCIDNLLWLLEQRVEIALAESFSEFVCLLVLMETKLLREQESPSSREREYALTLLAKIGTLYDYKKGAFIDTRKPQELTLGLIKENMGEDSETFGLLLLDELEFFVQKMTEGVKL